MRWLFMAVVLGFVALVGAAAKPKVVSSDRALDPTKTPGQNFNLTGFILQTPIACGSGVLEVTAPSVAPTSSTRCNLGDLPTYTSSNFYTDKTTGAMVLWTPSNGATTPGSHYPRTELRGQKEFNISSATTSETVTLAVLQTPKRNNIVIGQLKGASEPHIGNEPIKLCWKSGSIVASVKLKYGGSISDWPIATGLKVGQQFTFTMSVAKGVVSISANGSSTQKFTFDKSWDTTKVYWKFGNYCQDNSSTSGNGSRVAIYSFSVEYQYVFTQFSDGSMTGEHILAGAYTDKDVAAPPNGWPVVLVYHGGGEDAEEILIYSKLGNLAAVVISLQGQKSHNKLSWMNAFPWLKASSEGRLPRDDVRFTELVLGQVNRRLLKDLGDRGKLDWSRIYATGKSDGGGMAVFLAAHHELRKFDVRAIAPVSGAYFGVEQKYDTQDYILPPNADDYRAIVLAKEYTPLLEMHGTKDPVMPYWNKDQPFRDQNALDRSKNPGSFWSKAHGFADPKVAYTADIPSYWETWAEKVNGAQLAAQRFWKPSPDFKLHVYLKDQTRPLQHIEVVGGGHEWFGHTGDAASCTIDATMVISNFFEIPLINYRSPVVPETPKLPYVSSSP